MLALIDAGRWQDAEALIQAVLIEGPNDANSIETAALVAFHTDQKDLSADLLTSVCRATGYREEARVQQAFTGLLTVGRLFDAMDLLELGLDANPDNAQMRQLLRSFLIGTERHREAAKHAQILVKHRKFDKQLLLSMGDRRRRTREADSLVEMAKRNPKDLRPLIGKARFHLDRGRFQECIDILNQVIEQHPQDVHSQLMLGRAYSLVGKHDRLLDWSKSLPDSVVDFADYWLTLGDWAWDAAKHDVALHTYGAAAKRAPDRMQIWDKFAMALQKHRSTSTDLSVVKQRARLLAQLRLMQEQFTMTRKKHASDYVEISRVLVQLGRLWEAEAWTAIGQVDLSGASDSELAAIASMRATVVNRLSKQALWQSKLTLDLWANLSDDPAKWLAKLTEGDAKDQSQASSAKMTFSAPVLPRLVNEASRRGLNYFGATGKDLDQPGIRIHQTLGCGGCALDYDLDGWPDIYLAAAGGRPFKSDSDANALYRNDRGSMIEIKDNGVVNDTGFGQGVAVGDVNADGFDDLLVLNYGPNRLFVNCGDGTFYDATQSWELDRTNSAWSTSAAIADIDGDAIADAVIANYASGLEPSYVDCGSDGLEGHRSCSPLFFPAEPDTFLKGRNDGQWAEIAERWKAKPEILGRGLGVVVGSFAPESINSVYLVNDMTSNHYWSGVRRVADQSTDQSTDDQSFRLIESAALNGLANDASSRTQGSMGIATSDFNGDRLIDFYVTNFEHEYNTLYLSRDSLFWKDETIPRNLGGASMPMVGFGVKAVDLDLNGAAELAITNGHVDTYDGIEKKSQYAQPFQVFSQDPKGQFASVGSRIESAYCQSRHVGRALFMADIDRDGKRDLLVTHQTEPVALLMNQTPTIYRSLTIKLVATNSERTAIGTRVECAYSSNKIVTTLTSGGGYFCSDERSIQFGLGDWAESATISIDWPSGKKEQVELSSQHEWLLVEGAPPFSLDR